MHSLLEENCFFTLDVDAIILFLSQPHAYTSGDNPGLYRMLFMSLWGKIKRTEKKAVNVLNKHSLYKSAKPPA